MRYVPAVLSRACSGRRGAAGAAGAAVAAVAFGLAVMLAASPARAGEDEWLFGVHGFGGTMRTSATQWGGGAGLHAAYGLTAAWSIAASAGWRSFAAKTDMDGDPVPARHLAGGVAGATFAIDVLRVVPFLTAGVGAYAVVAGGAVKVAPAAEVGLSFDWAASRTIYLGLDLVRARFLYLESALATTFEVGLRATYVIW